MVRLLYITNGLSGSGGLERVLSLKASLLADEYAYEVHIVTLNEHNKPPFYYLSPRIKIHNLNKNRNILNYYIEYIKGLRNLTGSIRPDVISVCDDGLKGFFIPLILQRKYPVVYERHATIFLNFSSEHSSIFRMLQNKIIHAIMNLFAATFDYFVVLTQGNKKNWKLNNLVVIPNPVSFLPEESSSLDNKIVIAVGSHSYVKGYDLLLRAWKIVTEKHPSWRLNIFGKIDSDRTYVKMAREMQIDSSISFLDPVKEIQKEFLSSSIAVLPSRSEGFGMVLIEAMACGVPCVAFDCPYGPADIITNGTEGYLVNSEDYTAMADRIISLIENYNTRKGMGINAKNRAKSYLPERIMPGWNKIFSDLAGA